MHGLIQSTDKSALLRNLNTLDYRYTRLYNQMCLLKSLIEDGGGAETDPVFTASPAFSITSGDINNWNDATTLAHDHFNKATLDNITVAKVNNWDSAYTATQSLSTTYFPLVGGTITGTAGNGFVGLSLQSSAPTAPGTGVKLFSDSTSRFSWKTPLDAFTRTITTTAAITADRVYSFPDSSGEVMVSGPAQTMAGVKTFSSNISHGGNITPTVNGTRLIGSATFQYLSAYTRAVIGDSLFVGANGSTNLTFGYNGGSNISATLFNGGNFLIQNGGTHTNAGFLLDVTGTSRLNGNSTIGGNISPDADGTRTLGTSSLRWNTVFTPIVQASTNLVFRSAASSGFQFQKTGTTDFVALMFGATNNWYLQNAGSVPIETNYRFTINGTGATNGALYTIGQVRMDGINTYADNVAALADGRVVGQLYKLADGSIKIVI